MTPSNRPGNPRARFYATRRDHLRALWVERLRAAAEEKEGGDGDSRPGAQRTILPTPTEWLAKGGE